MFVGEFLIKLLVFDTDVEGCGAIDLEYVDLVLSELLCDLLVELVNFPL